MYKTKYHIYTQNDFNIPIILKIFWLIIGCTGLLFFKVIRPFCYIRIATLSFGRVGELAFDAEVYLRWRAGISIHGSEKHIFLSGVPPNKQLLAMFSRKARVLQTNKYILWLVQKLKKIFPMSKIWLNLRFFSRKDVPDFYPFFNSQPNQLSFTLEEEQQGQKLLRQMGVPEGASFVCVHARDKVYLDRILQYQNNLNKGDSDGWRYHDYRDVNIESYIPAMEYLSSKGIYVIRMGYMVEKELKINNPHIIDYAIHYRNDFGDIYLSAKCKFFIGSEGGLIAVPWCFQVPTAYSNGIPLDTGGKQPKDIYLPKKLWLSSEERFLSFREVLALRADRWIKSCQYEQAGVKVINNSSEEIMGLVQEMNSRLDNTWQPLAEDEILQQKYLEIWPLSFRMTNVPLPRISAVFLRLNTILVN